MKQYTYKILPPKVDIALEWVTTILRRHKVRYQICGGLSARFYGATRRINDIDIDIKEEDFTRVQSMVKRYIISGPDQYIDKKWDVLMMSIKYKGQLIEFTNADNAKISNQTRTKWLKFKYDLDNVTVFSWKGRLINLMKAKNILEYKKHLDGKKQREDIQAIKKHIANQR